MAAWPRRAFKQAVARRDGRVVALERYPADKAQMQAPVKTVAQAAMGASRADAIFIPDGADGVPAVVQIADRQRRRSQTRAAARHRPVGGCADLLQSAARRRLVCRRPTPTGFRNFSGRYRSRYGQDPVRTASLAYDAVALVAALVKTQGQQRFSESVLTTAPASPASTGCSASAPTAPTSAGLR